MDSLRCPFGHHVFTYTLAQLSSTVLSGKFQSRGLVLVSFSRSPLFYVDLLKDRGLDPDLPQKWLHILDCYTDPLGWKDRLSSCGKIRDLSREASSTVTVYRGVKDLAKLYSSIIELGKGLVAHCMGRFSVAIDSVSEMLRHTSMTSVAGLMSNLRTHEKISSTFWLLRSDLHGIRETASFEYLSTMIATLEPVNQSTGPKGDSEDFSLLEMDSGKGRICVRFKRRNGRVRVMCEDFHVERTGIKNLSVSSKDKIINKDLLPKVQFNLQLSEKERLDRAKVVLPFEHQGNGRTIDIYDGRRSLAENKDEKPPSTTEKLDVKEDSSKGEIIYYRDSDDEMPDSDEDPDDDLDI